MTIYINDHDHPYRRKSVGKRICSLCKHDIPNSKNAGAVYCSEKCGKKASYYRLSKVNGKRVTRSYRELVISALGDICCQCGSAERLEIDHVSPLPDGQNTFKNVQLLCVPCHVKKTTLERKQRRH